MTGINPKSKHTFESGWHESMHTNGSLKDLYRNHRAEQEFEFAESDFYEDNIYDEPEYWRSTQLARNNVNQRRL